MKAEDLPDKATLDDVVRFVRGTHQCVDLLRSDITRDRVSVRRALAKDRKVAAEFRSAQLLHNDTVDTAITAIKTSTGSIAKAVAEPLSRRLYKQAITAGTAIGVALVFWKIVVTLFPFAVPVFQALNHMVMR